MLKRSRQKENLNSRMSVSLYVETLVRVQNNCLIDTNNEQNDGFQSLIHNLY
jgi:hypothetical protein